MPFYLRTVRKRPWTDKKEIWLERDDAPADCLSHLRTRDDKLSLWLIDDKRSNLERVAVAVAATRDSPQNFDFVLIPEEQVTRLGLSLERSEGGTPDDEVNRYWHFDAVGLSARLLLTITMALLRGGGTFDRKGHKDVESALREALAKGRIASADLNDNMRDKLGIELS